MQRSSTGSHQTHLNLRRSPLDCDSLHLFGRCVEVRKGQMQEMCRSLAQAQKNRNIFDFLEGL